MAVLYPRYAVMEAARREGNAERLMCAGGIGSADLSELTMYVQVLG
jgi:hypothetical protein